MNTIEIVTQYIADIPWSDYPAFVDTPVKYQLVLESLFDVVPIYDHRISYLSDHWDFRPYYHHKNRHSLSIHFDKVVPAEIKELSKMFVVHRILENDSPETPHGRLRVVKRIMQIIERDTGKDSIMLISFEDLRNAIDSQKKIKVQTKRYYWESILIFWRFLIEDYKMELPIDLGRMESETLSVRNKAKKEVDKYRMPDIPLPLMKAIEDTATRVMRDKNSSYLERSFACLLLIITQLGLRLGDALNLRINSLKTIRLVNVNVQVSFIHYSTSKPSRGRGPLLEFDMYATDLCKEAYETLSELRKEHPDADKVDYLYLPYNRMKHKGHERLYPVTRYPANNQKFNDEYERFIYKYLYKECSTPWEGIAPCRLSCLKGRIEFKDEVDKLFYYPDTRQYRVRVCTALYEKGVPLSYIKKFMGHLTEDMIGYYCRPKDSFKENLDYSRKVIQSMVGEDTTPIGVNGDHLKAKLKEFVASQKYNVYTDIDEIINTLGNKLVIRAKTGGVCIKTSMIPCADEVSTNKLLCAFNLCPNVYHFYWMADVSYLDFKTAEKAYSQTQENGFEVEASKQKAMAKSIITRRLLPELTSLKNAIQEHGPKTVMERYPSLIEIIGNLDNILKEIQLWLIKN